MTELEQILEQTQQDNIALDYTKWSAQRIQAKLSNSHDLWIEERDRVLARQRFDNAAARQRHLNSFEAQRAEKQKENDALLDKELAPQKQTLMREWLAAHPDQTPADFEKKAWIHYRANLIEERSQKALEATMADFRETGRYSL